MSLKELLGLEAFDLSDVEIITKITEARRNNIEFLEFTSNKKKVSIRLIKNSNEGQKEEYFGWYG